MNAPHDQLGRDLLEVPVNSTNTLDPIISDPAATVNIVVDLPTTMPLPPRLDPESGFCNDALTAPNGSVCCDVMSGMWVLAPVQGYVPATASGMIPACPTGTGVAGSPGSGGGIGKFRG